MINNPIIHKEVLTSLRTKKALAMQCLFLLVTGGLLWLLWPAGGLQDVGGEQARRILSVMALGELIMVVMFAPAFTASSLTSEKERNTMESLFATTMKPGEIVIGKMAGSLTFLLLLTLSGIPAIAAPFLLGGVDHKEVITIVGITLLSAGYLGMIGLFISTIMKKSYRSIICTYVVLLIICIGLAMPAWPIGDGASLLKRCDANVQAVIHTIASLSPVQAMVSLVWPQSAYAQGAVNMPPFWLMFLPLSAGMIVVTTIACLVKLRKPFAPPRPRETLKVIERGQVTAKTVVWHMWFFDPRRRRKHIAGWQNPVLMKEFRTRPMLQTRWLLRTFGICLISSVLLMFIVSLGVSAFISESTQMIPMMATAVAAMMVVLIVLIGPAIAGGAICSDLETGVWELLKASPVRSWRIVSGKFQASIIPMVLLAMATLPALLILLYFNINLWHNVLRVCAVIGMTILFVATAGTFFSSIFKRTAIATAWTYALVVSITLLTLLMLLSQDIFSQNLVKMVFVTNPVIAAMDAAGNVEMQKLGLRSQHLMIMGIATASLFLVTVIRVFQLRRAK